MPSSSARISQSTPRKVTSRSANNEGGTISSRTCNCFGSNRTASGNSSFDDEGGFVGSGKENVEIGKGCGGRIDRTGGRERGKRIRASPSRVTLYSPVFSVFSIRLIRAARISDHSPVRRACTHRTPSARRGDRSR
jgi:hypothetical protein